MSEPSDAAVGGDSVVITQRGSPSDFLGLSLRNGLLNLVTLTLYRFWGRTEVRRRLWASTYLNGEAFEYTGRGKELFLGFLVALAVVGLPFLIAVFGAQFLGPALALPLILGLYLFLGFLYGYGRFTAFRYLASRTSWRGVRFQLKGSPGKFGGTTLGYGLLSGVSLGWFWPAAERRLAGRIWGGLSFGDRPFQFRIEEARKEKIYPAYALGWVLGIVAYAAFVGGMMAVLAPLTKAAEAGGPPAVPTLREIALIYGLMIPFLFAFVVILAPFHAAMARSIVAGIGFDEVRFKLALTWVDVAVISVTNVLFLFVSLGFLMPFIEARTRKLLIDRLTVVGAADLSAIGQAPAGPRTGEGLADAFGAATV